MCARNNRVIVLTNVNQGKLLDDVDCVEVVNINTQSTTVTEMPWQSGNDSSHDKVCFDRWYILRDWMAQTKTTQVDGH